MDLSLDTLRTGLVQYGILLLSLSVHEFAHAIVAERLGDTTPRSQGRVTLNPSAHIDPLGTVVLPLVMILLNPGFAIFGWGKPVQVNPRNFRQWARDDISVALAGPASNLLICAGVALVGGIAMRFAPPQLLDLIVMALVINAVLIVFNLVPVPPLDGSHVLKHAIGMSEETYFQFASWGFVVILVLINLPPFQAVLRAGIGAVAGPFIAILRWLSGGA